MPDPNKLRQERAKLLEQARSICKKADDEKRDMTPEEEQECDRMLEDADRLMGNISREEKLLAEERAVKEFQTNPIRPLTKEEETEDRDLTPLASKSYRKSFDRWLHLPRGHALPYEEQRAMEVGTVTEGGYWVADEFDKSLVQAEREMNVMRQLATVIQTGSGTYNIPVETTATSFTWLDEEASFTETTPVTGRKTLSAYKSGGIILVSHELLADSMFDLQGYIRDQFAMGQADVQEAAFVNGDGSSKPEGVVVGSTLGKSFASSTAITADEIIDLYHACPPRYRKNATWLMKDSTIKLIRKLTEAVNGQYIWQPGLKEGQPDMLLGRPLVTSDDMPAATTGLKSVIFGDLKYYKIADRGPAAVQRLDELYARTGQVGFLTWRRTDGVLTLAEAVYHGIQA